MESAAGSLLQPLVIGVKDQLRYIWSYKTYIKDLKDELTNLKNVSKMRQEEVNTAIHNAQQIYVEVTDWLEQANNIIEQANEVIKQHDNSKKGCFRIPNPSTRFLIARQAEEKKQEIDKLKKRSDIFRGVSHPPLPTGIVMGSYKGRHEYWLAPSRASLLVKISKDLLDPKIRIVGVWGASGVGKSIFLKQLEKQVQEREHNYDFDAVTMAIVSRSPNWEKVQDDLGFRLGLKMGEENSVAQKADRLRERLRQKGKGKVLIILDDIWEKVGLDYLGIPFDDNHPEIKLLLTSRSEQVLRDKMDSEHNVHLEPLKPSEALDLFKQILGDRAGEEATLIDQLANECAGLPVLISLLATSLKFLPSSKWVDALDKLRKSNRLGIENIIDESMKFSYHAIESEEEKSLFLLCGQVGAQIISIDFLMMLGMGLGLLKGVYTLEEAREKGKLLLDNLKASCLLEDSGKGFVKIHDLIGDAALSIASKTCTSLVIRSGKMLKACSEDVLRRCKAISLCYPADIIDELPEELMCPELDMLLVSVFRNNAGLKIADAFFKNTRKLKILHLFGMMLHSLPSSIQFLNELHTLHLLDVRTTDLRVIGKLKTLQVLTLSGYEILTIPKEFGELKSLRFLDLIGCYQLGVIEPNVLGSLTRMEELHLPLSFDKWDAEGTSNASLNELNNMSRLSALVIFVPSAALLTNNMPFQQLVRYKIYIGSGRGFGVFGEERTLRLGLESSSSKLIVKELLQTTLRKTQDLCLYGWSGFEESITDLSKDGFLDLKHIRVENCPSIKYIIHSKKPNAVPVLESLLLCCLTNLQKICQGDLPPKSLGSLKVIKVEACNKLRNLLSSSLVRDLPNLECIEVSDCEMVQEIITYTEMDRTDVKEVIAPNDEFELLELKCLRTLKLAYSPNISSFCSKGNREIVEDEGSTQFEFLDGRQVLFPCLESLTLSGLPKLRKISHNEYPVKLPGLRSLELHQCKSLLYAVDASFLLQLRNLESLTIENCESMETVFNLEGLDVKGSNLNDQPLKIKLKLCGLPKLKTIWNENPKNISDVFKLERLEVYGCGRLKYLFTSSMAKSLENISHISIASCVTMTEIFLEEENDDQEIKFSLLSYLSISKMDNLAMFSHGNHYYCFPCLIQLMIFFCPKMRAFVSVKSEEEAADATGHSLSFFNEKVDLPILEMLVLHSLSMISIWGNNLSKDSFYKLAYIQIEKCARVSSIFPSHLEERLQNLTQVKVESCYLLEVLFEYGQRKLTSQPSGEAALSFPSLRDIFVENCHSLISLFPNTIARGLSELVNMYISSCGRLEEVVSFDGKEGDIALTEAMIFHNLSSLQLKKLGNLVHFCSGHYELYFPFLKKLSIIECAKLKAFILRPQNPVRREERLLHVSSTSDTEVDISPLFDEKVTFPNLQELLIKGLNCEEIWPKHEPAGFQMDLKTFTVEDCHQLSIIVPSHILPHLHSLESMSVKSCNALEVVFKLGKYRQKVLRGKSTTKILEKMRKLTVSLCESMRHIIATRDDDQIEETYQKTIKFPQLSSLKLSESPELDTFCHENHEIELPSLARLEIEDCGSVEILVADSSQHCKPLLLVEKVEFPGMVSMVINNMQKLMELWHISKEGIQCSSEAFCQLQSLGVRHCDMLLAIFPSKMIRAFRNLEKLTVNYCESLESVFESTSTGLSSGTESNRSNDAVPTTFALNMLDLKDLPRMKHVWDVEDPRWVYLSFEKLSFIYVFGCRSLRYLFPVSIAKFLHKMRGLRIMDGEGMEGIVWNGESAHHQSLPSSSIESTYNFSLVIDSLEWPSLEHLRLQNCPKAKIFASAQQKVNIPSLQTLGADGTTLENGQFLDEMYVDPTRLILWNIQNQAWVESIPWLSLLKRFPNLRALQISHAHGDSNEIFPDPDNEMEGAIVSCKPGILDMVKDLEIYRCNCLTTLPRFLALFHNLTDLKVTACHGLQHLATSSSVARGLVQLTELEIFGCNNLEEIVTYCWENNNGSRAKDDCNDTISFPNLKQLKLCNLPRFRSFSSMSCSFSFPSLRIVHMVNLPMVHVFCEGGFTNPYKHRITRSVRALHNHESNASFICPGTSEK